MGPQLDSTGHAWHHPDQQISDWIANGKLGLATSMPAYGKDLNSEEISLVIEYIKTLWTEGQRQFQADITSRYRTE